MSEVIRLNEVTRLDPNLTGLVSLQAEKRYQSSLALPRVQRPHEDIARRQTSASQCLRPSGSLIKCELVAGPGDAKVNGAVQVFSRCIPLAQGPSHPIYIPYSVSSPKVIPGWSRGWDGEALDSSFLPFLP